MTSANNYIVGLMIGLSVTVISASAASAITLEALCSQADVTRDVLRFSKRLKYPVEARTLKPTTAYFEAESGQMSCTYTLAAGNAYDFGKFKATFTDGPRYGTLKVISLTPVP